MRIFNSPKERAQAISAQQKVDKIISIHSPNTAFPLFPGVQSNQILRLCFNDIIKPQRNLKIITQNDIKKIINFVTQPEGGDILVHCYAGVSRSIAVTMIILFLLGKNIHAKKLVSLVRNKAPFANPNRLVLMQAGRVLNQERFFMDLIKYFEGHKRIIKAKEFYIEF